MQQPTAAPGAPRANSLNWAVMSCTVSSRCPARTREISVFMPNDSRRAAAITQPAVPVPGHPRRGVRSGEVTARVVLHLDRFVEYLTGAYGHDRLLGGAPGRVRLAGPPGGWPGPSTVNHHQASVSRFLARVGAQGCGALPEGNPAAGVRTVVPPPPEPRAPTAAQVRCRAEVT